MSADDNDRALVVFLDGQDPVALARLKALVDARTRKPVPPPTNGPTTYRGIPVPGVLHHNWDQPEAAWWRQGVKAALDIAVPLLDELHNDEPCVLDHHGYCQMHGLPQPGPCPDGEIQEFIKEARNEG
ncbi:hypothetical protein [Streptomyces sp. S1D4-14]|uniref:hypothetical protein n=1 Tax=Streptomyces sp. S1D4-14 TaxID=2594461 RepID=UPI001164A93A|nr:hypothetical protein [Streptomyces sp. S1D4-14]QDN64397.1 hypothetical protein FNV66_00770 [Streptomyces sp. S1D4-14]